MTTLTTFQQVVRTLEKGGNGDEYFKIPSTQTQLDSLLQLISELLQTDNLQIHQFTLLTLKKLLLRANGLMTKDNLIKINHMLCDLNQSLGFGLPKFIINLKNQIVGIITTLGWLDDEIYKNNIFQMLVGFIVDARIH
jgi:hypothetical protein